MEIVIQETKTVERTVNIEFPYYYKQDLCLDNCNSVIYGKITENGCTSIQITREYDTDDMQYELEIEKGLPGQRFGCYFASEYISSEAEYLDAKSKMTEALNNA